MRNSYFSSKGLFFILVLSFFVVQANAQSLGKATAKQYKEDIESGMQFFVGKWEQAKEMASLMRRPIFVFVYTDYSSASKNMLRNVFTNNQVVESFTQNFVNYKINLHSEQGMQFRSEHSLSEYPALLFFDESGNFLGKDAGEKTIQQFVSIGDAYIQDPQANTSQYLPVLYTNYLDLRIQYQNGIRTEDFLYDYAYQLKKFNDIYEHVVEEYLLTANLTSGKSLRFVYDFAESIDSKAFDFMLKNQSYYVGLYGWDKFEDKIKKTIYKSIVTAASSYNRTMFDHALSVAKASNLRNVDKFILDISMDYYQKVKDWNAFVGVLRNYVKANANNPEVLDLAAWSCIANVDNPSITNEAYEWVKKANQIRPNESQYIETHAAILYKMGKKSKALKEADRAIAIAQKARNRDYTTTMKLKDIINNGLDIPADLRTTSQP